ncbi:hypothetical protein Mal64_26510 [Pseudobythopirellula maris]|uniref:Ser-Thr-rich glycosyl-phosphatidyl-inositol-anchored membrane family protein n=2 Tax=Pseudobythopirellula maris TaxID=2527991 RepID=A0A5C5ZIQ0_9BACT|nr:hypothetical protein Mal64_26510 [Pseudobythopirellula maris]
MAGGLVCALAGDARGQSAYGYPASGGYPANSTPANGHSGNTAAGPRPARSPIASSPYASSPYAMAPGSASPYAAASAPAPAPVAAPAVAAAPLYWRQHSLAIPYRWSTAAHPSTASQVALYASTDGGATWREAGRAQPHVRSFVYQAEGDGEYCFAIRTYDRAGRANPAGELTPELRVVVDTRLPVFTALEGRLNDRGEVEIDCAVRDTTLDLSKLRLYARGDGQPDWAPVEPRPVASASYGGEEGRTAAAWRPPVGCSRVELRAAIEDRAGNRSEAGAVVALQAAPIAGPPSDWPRAPDWPQDSEQRVTGQSEPGPYQAPGLQAEGPQLGAAGAGVPRNPFGPYERQPSLFDQVATQTPNAPARPAVQPRRPMGSQAGALASTTSSTSGWRALDSPAPTALAPPPPQSQPWPAPAPTYRPPVASAPPSNQGLYHQASNSHSASGSAPTGRATHADNGARPHGALRASQPIDMRCVNRTDFEVEYELADVGQWGVAKVELWGTADGGRSWRRFAIDSDNQSPIHVTAPGEGEYGFRVIVESVGGLEPETPQPGDRPELSVVVDLRQPNAEVLRVRQGEGYFADHLVIDWRVDDQRLSPDPINLYYSDRPTGPWIPIATRLANSGSHSWRLQRHLPGRLFLRLEASDLAGNTTTVDVPEPVTLDLPRPAGVIRGVR